LQQIQNTSNDVAPPLAFSPNSLCALLARWPRGRPTHKTKNGSGNGGRGDDEQFCISDLDQCRGANGSTCETALARGREEVRAETGWFWAAEGEVAEEMLQLVMGA
jgi:hypothetical protein